VIDAQQSLDLVREIGGGDLQVELAAWLPSIQTARAPHERHGRIELQNVRPSARAMALAGWGSGIGTISARLRIPAQRRRAAISSVDRCAW
jgi:hypothetical protein